MASRLLILMVVMLMVVMLMVVMLMVVIVVIKPMADSEDMTIGVSYVHLAQVPGRVRRRPRHFESLLKTVLMDRVHVINKDAHPRALI